MSIEFVWWTAEVINDNGMSEWIGNYFRIKRGEMLEIENIYRNLIYETKKVKPTP